MMPVLSLGAEHLVMGHLMRRNILAFKAPPNNEGYDLICMHPNPRKVKEQLRIQVKSRYQTDCDRAPVVKRGTLDAFDYLVLVFLNVGYFYGGGDLGVAGRQPPEFYTFSRRFVAQHLYKPRSGMDKLHTAKLNIFPYKDEAGFEWIARDLGIPYPERT
jgi:hypothetical protein